MNKRVHEIGTSVCFWGGPSGRLEGVVRALTGNVPIEGVLVQPQQVPDFTVTDANGFYSLPLEPGTYTICYSREGFCDTCFTNIVIEDNNTTRTYRFPGTPPSPSLASARPPLAIAKR